MKLATTILFVMALSLLFTHEMDAVRNGEWRMFAGLNRLSEAEAHRLFTSLHIPLYALLLYLLLGGYTVAAYYIVDVFLILHTALHALFRRHRQNGFKSGFSLTIIYSMGVLAALHLAAKVWW